MLHAIVQVRALLAMTVAVAVGAWGLHAYPVAWTTTVFLQMIDVRKPLVFHVLAYGYATLWFTHAVLRASPCCCRSSRSSCPGAARRSDPHALPPYPAPEQRPAPTLVLGETHFHDHAGTRARRRRG